MKTEMFVKGTAKIALCTAFGVGTGIAFGTGMGIMAGTGAFIVVVCVKTLATAIATANKQQQV